MSDREAIPHCHDHPQCFSTCPSCMDALVVALAAAQPVLEAARRQVHEYDELRWVLSVSDQPYKAAIAATNDATRAWLAGRASQEGPPAPESVAAVSCHFCVFMAVGKGDHAEFAAIGELQEHTLKYHTSDGHMPAGVAPVVVPARATSQVGAAPTDDGTTPRPRIRNIGFVDNGAAPAPAPEYDRCPDPECRRTLVFGVCPDCGPAPAPCPECGGTGQTFVTVTRVRGRVAFQTPTPRPCPSCTGAP